MNVSGGKRGGGKNGHGKSAQGSLFERLLGRAETKRQWEKEGDAARITKSIVGTKREKGKHRTLPGCVKTDETPPEKSRGGNFIVKKK